MNQLANAAQPTTPPSGPAQPGAPVLTMSGPLSIASAFGRQLVVGVGDLAVSNDAEVILSTYGLGSCVGVVAFDPVVQVGGILHLMLPDSSIARDMASRQPAMFADTGFQKFFAELAALGAVVTRMNFFISGGASVLAGTDRFKIGERNVRATLDILAKHGCHTPTQEVGGVHNRSLHLEMRTSCVTMKTPLASSRCTLAA